MPRGSIGLEADPNPYLNVTNRVISFNATDEVFYGSLPGGIFASSNCTFFGNNNVAGPPGGPSSRVSAQAVVRTGHTPPPSDEVRQRQP
ncbi:MAG TPA: hypothetical protein VKB88_22760 [Bryobacteraceae bacterium]|nr:hypothetical protein [Bryobacteraceae bacterium]